MANTVLFRFVLGAQHRPRAYTDTNTTLRFERYGGPQERQEIPRRVHARAPAAFFSRNPIVVNVGGDAGRGRTETLEAVERLPRCGRFGSRVRRGRGRQQQGVCGLDLGLPRFLRVLAGEERIHSRGTVQTYAPRVRLRHTNEQGELAINRRGFGE